MILQLWLVIASASVDFSKQLLCSQFVVLLFFINSNVCALNVMWSVFSFCNTWFLHCTKFSFEQHVHVLYCMFIAGPSLPIRVRRLLWCHLHPWPISTSHEVCLLAAHLLVRARSVRLLNPRPLLSSVIMPLPMSWPMTLTLPRMLSLPHNLTPLSSTRLLPSFTRGLRHSCIDVIF
jgi:hypothetical protein